MSVVTNVVILADGEDAAAVAFLNSWFESTAGPDGRLTRVDVCAVGPKAMEAAVYAGGINYLDLQDFRTAIMAAPWRHPEFVQVLIKGQESSVFWLYAGEQVDDRRYIVDLHPKGTFQPEPRRYTHLRVGRP